MKILSVVGARPEFIQAWPVSRALRKRHLEILVHTGQHYDFRMSQTFFDELDIPAPDYNLGVASGSHAAQTADTLVRLADVLSRERPDVVIVRGDTNSTLGAALAARQVGIPLAHIEAGERSYDRSMPEETNRVVTDHLAGLHFCASRHALDNLAAEGIRESVHLVGDVMFDGMLLCRPVASQRSSILRELRLEPRRYALVTVHRAGNTDNPGRLGGIVDALNQVAETIVFPVHPRTWLALNSIGAAFGDHVRVVEPLGFFDLIALEDNARLIATDSGGVQREAYFLQIPCLTLRDETEWVETVATGWNRLVGADTALILDSWFNFTPPAAHPLLFGDGAAAERIVQVLEERTGAGRFIVSEPGVRNEGCHPVHGASSIGSAESAPPTDDPAGPFQARITR